jgi:predicted DNA-binding protein (UPF0278 family)
MQNNRKKITKGLRMGEECVAKAAHLITLCKLEAQRGAINASVFQTA